MRERYFRLKKKSPTNEYLIKKYTDICGEIKTKRFKVRAEYNSNLINSSINNPKQLWKNINEIIYNKQKNENEFKLDIN